MTVLLLWQLPPPLQQQLPPPLSSQTNKTPGIRGLRLRLGVPAKTVEVFQVARLTR